MSRIGCGRSNSKETKWRLNESRRSNDRPLKSLKMMNQFSTKLPFFVTTNFYSNRFGLHFNLVKSFHRAIFGEGNGNSPIIRNFMFSFRKKTFKGHCQPLLGRSFIFIRSDKVIFSIEYCYPPHLPFIHIFSWSVPNIEINFFLTKNDILTKNMSF